MITKAIISVAGWGTRRLPITKAIEKCMLPIGNRPLVDYVVQDCISAGIKDIYFVISEGSTQLKQYYSNNDSLNQYLIHNGKNDALKVVAAPQNVTFHYIEQPMLGKYGTAIPVALASQYIVDNESVVVLGGDDFIYNSGAGNAIEDLINGTPEKGVSLLGAHVSAETVGQYGVLEVSEDSDFIRIVEKPGSDHTPSTLINISKYVLNHAVVKLIDDFVNSHQLGEYYITDPINQYVAEGGRVKVLEAQGEYLDGGTVEGWLHANRVVLGDIA